MPEVTYVSVTWTAGDIITEAKMDNMVANDRAVDAMNNGVRMTERSDPSTPPANTVHLYAKDKSGVSSLYYIDDSGAVHQLQSLAPIFTFPVPGALGVATNLTSALIVTKSLTAVKAYAYVKTAPVGASLLIQIQKNGSNLWNTSPDHRLAIASGSQSGSTVTFDTTSFAEGDTLTLNVDQVGSTTAGSDLTVELATQ